MTVNERIRVVDDFLRIPGLEKSSLVKDAYIKWQDLQLEKFQAHQTPAQRYVEGTLVLADPRMGSGEAKKVITDAMRELKKEDAIKPEVKAVPLLMKLRSARDDDKVKRDDLKKLYQAVIEKYQGTYAAALAANDLAEL
jgi:hypothetical protein